jgi:rhodanese-related sulfurtransferase
MPAGFVFAPTVAVDELAARLPRGDTTVLDLATSLKFRDRHVPGAWWAVRARLAAVRERLVDARLIVLTSEDGTLAHFAAPEAAALWPAAEVRVLAGGNAAWFAADAPTESGIERATTLLDDVWYKPYDHAQGYEQHARAYLTWEVGLVEQIKREPAIRFRAYD